MSAPRLEIDLAKISANARALVERLKERGIAVTGVTKAALGCPVIASALLDAGVSGIGDSRIENIERMRAALGEGPRMTLLRSPMLSQVERVVRSADISFNTELAVVRALSDAARLTHRTHGVVLMVELGDLREGIMPEALLATAREVAAMPNIVLKGIGTNLACLSGTAPDAVNMGTLSFLARSVEQALGLTLEIVSGGNSANIDWVFGQEDHGRINDLRLGEAILLGRETLTRKPIEGLYLDAFRLVAEVIEAKVKPSKPWGVIAQNAFGEAVPIADRGEISQVIVAVGRQDCDPAGLECPAGVTILGASSDHLVIETDGRVPLIGSEIAFGINYSALLRTMTSPFVEKAVIAGISRSEAAGDLRQARILSEARLRSQADT
ncbi:alanine/ornithine racemase family PLP-dependent enzyme [Novosphingobium sp. G106]|uniref:alanine/ornithine racemase family PLP-dependent enzyme n=1 Tax=Novosphingobium sp. G106 TaxID=2849500 RepID=UPI001C2CCD9C|nr:alanine/ornithine racemase family PLP-dependent enzyme [Novosphingobium sp. G106]MBV1687743.1 alanine/ornithine racemase family PLP-dependent enzyme [Novosphingobium sp. G106]